MERCRAFKHWVICWGLTTAWGVSPVLASNDIQSMLCGGMSLFNQTNSTLVGQTGIVGLFQVQMRDRWIRPTFGAMAELNSTTTRLWDGHAQLGVELVAYRASYLKPFLSVMGDFGWASYTSGTANYVGIVYGVVIGAGAEFRLSEKDSALGFRIFTAWRFLTGTIGGGLTGSDLNSMLILGGLVF